MGISGFSVSQVDIRRIDGLPGLVVDRYGDVVACQVGPWDGKARALMHELWPTFLALRSRVSKRRRIARTRRLAPGKGIARGSLPGKHLVELDGIGYRVDVLGGQKSGMYLDQRDNRKEIRRWAPGKKVRDSSALTGMEPFGGRGRRLETVGVDGSATPWRRRGKTLP